MNLGWVLALCFAECAETYHHWYVYGGLASGVCLEFDKEVLVAGLGSTIGVRCDSVDYRLIGEPGASQLATSELPFIKRFAFKDEKEFRIIFETEDQTLEEKRIPFNSNAMTGVTLNPWMPEVIFESVKSTLKSIDGWAHLDIRRTRLIDNDQWKRLADSATLPSNRPLQPASGGQSDVE